MSTYPEGLIPSPAEYRAHQIARDHLDSARRAFDRIDAFVLPRTVPVTAAMRESLQATLQAAAQTLQQGGAGGAAPARSRAAPALARLIPDSFAAEPLAKDGVTDDPAAFDVRRRWVITAARRLVCVHAPTRSVAAPGEGTEQWIEQHPNALKVMATTAKRAAQACR
ncbi:hypothetical protein [Streptomonospora salina]|uniref:Uncharacterized protein n=1 Tax=Streptomonospora salina TaxID=104205 RepID=A0A841EH15_9ACTN|nr:hypothetical protein [Streptomonospora salina]MBB6000118.1 hypothetical protein [Streptomonospora salina]